MKFSVSINGVKADDIEAKNANAAVDAARAAHEPPDEGGEFAIEVSDESGAVVSSFRVRHEPAEHMRDVVEAAAKEKADAEAKAAERERIKAEVRAELEAEGKAVSK